MFEPQDWRAFGGEVALRISAAGALPRASDPGPGKARFLAVGVLLVVAWWLVSALSMVLVSMALGLKPQDYDAATPFAEIVLLSLVVAPLLENALAIGVYRLARRFMSPSRALWATVLLIAALHLIYAWRALAAVGLFAVVLVSYVYWEKPAPRFAWISGMVMHAAFNLAPTVIVGLGRAGYLK